VKHHRHICRTAAPHAPPAAPAPRLAGKPVPKPTLEPAQERQGYAWTKQVCWLWS
jgi:hypothetical protein